TVPRPARHPLTPRRPPSGRGCTRGMLSAGPAGAGAGVEDGMGYDVAAVREHFPALRAGTAHFDAPGGSQVPDVVAAAVAATLTSPIANRGTVTAAERAADDVVRAARAAVADLLGADPGGVVFGRSATQLTYDLSRVLSAGWGP